MIEFFFRFLKLRKMLYEDAITIVAFCKKHVNTIRRIMSDVWQKHRADSCDSVLGSHLMLGKSTHIYIYIYKTLSLKRSTFFNS